MKRLLLLFSLITFLSGISSSNNQLPGTLERLDGVPTTYYSLGSKVYAAHLQELLYDAVTYFDTATNEREDFELFVLNQEDAIDMNASWPMPFSTDNPNRIFMPNQGYFKIQLTDNSNQEDKFHVSDFIAVHEMGHILWHKRLLSNGKARFKNHKWIGEFIADYYMMGYLADKFNIEKYPNWLPIASNYLPLRHKTLMDFEVLYTKLNKLNYVAYQSKFNELALIIYPKKRWNFLSEIDQLYDSLNNLGLDRRASFPIINDHISLINSESADWFKEMKHTWHPFLLGLVLFGVTISSYLKIKIYALRNRIFKVLTILLFISSISCSIIFITFYFI